MPETTDKIKVIPYEERYAPDFIRLNREWLEGFGLLENADAKHLNSPRESIIDQGGQIFLPLKERSCLERAPQSVMATRLLRLQNLPLHLWRKGVELGGCPQPFKKYCHETIHVGEISRRAKNNGFC